MDNTYTIPEAVKSKVRLGQPVSLLFVCLGNICRSPAAEEIMRQVAAAHGDARLWRIDSAGTGRWHVGDLPDRRMRLHARDRGYALKHICRQIDSSDFDRFDLIIGMDQSNVDDLKELAPTVEAAGKITPMAAFFPEGCRYYSVPDPYYEGAEGFELVLDLLQDACGNLYKRIKNDK